VPTRKQRRRRAKEQRHEYEVVYVDDEGNEVEVDPDELQPPKERPQKHKADRAEVRGRGRGIDPPSWRRTFRRGLIFAPIFFATVLLIMPDRELAAAVFQTLLLLVIFIPFSYFMDRVFWRSYQKRLARSSGGS
jgi:hypothetical protein